MAKGTKFSFILARLAVDILDDSANGLLTGFANRHANSTVTSTEIAETNNYSQTEVR